MSFKLYEYSLDQGKCSSYPLQTNQDILITALFSVWDDMFWKNIGKSMYIQKTESNQDGEGP